MDVKIKPMFLAALILFYFISDVRTALLCSNSIAAQAQLYWLVAETHIMCV